MTAPWWRRGGPRLLQHHQEGVAAALFQGRGVGAAIYDTGLQQFTTQVFVGVVAVFEGWWGAEMVDTKRGAVLSRKSLR